MMKPSSLESFYKTSGIISGTILTLFFAAGAIPSEKELIVDTFTGATGEGGIPEGWKILKFPKIPRHTVYTLEKEDRNFFIKAVSNSSASAVYKEVSIDLREYPLLSWMWKVSRVVEKADARKKEGDDYAARVYVTFEYEPEKATVIEKLKYALAKTLYGLDPPGNAINYIWDNRLDINTYLSNPYTEKVMMVVVERGPEKAGRWVAEERNVYEDYRNFFKDEPPMIKGIAVMTDTDNTKESAVSYYDDIIFRKR